MLNPNTLPVAPEFVETLQEQAVYALRKCLEKLNAPKPVIDLVFSVNDLAFYERIVYEHPDDVMTLLQTDEHDGFDIVGTVRETINNLAAVGATFQSGVSYSNPRKGTLLDDSKQGIPVAIEPAKIRECVETITA